MSLLKKEPVTLHAGKHLALRAVGHWEYAERTKASGCVAILAVTDDHKILLVEQERIPVGRRVIELPAGLAGDIAGFEHEELALAAARELEEETGYHAGAMTFLMEGPSSAGMTTEVMSFFRADQLQKKSAGGGDGSEAITVHEVPLGELEPWLESRRQAGCLVDYKIYAALYFAKQSP